MNRNQPVAIKGMILVALVSSAVMSLGIIAGSAFGAAPIQVPKQMEVASGPNLVANQANQATKPLETLLNEDGTLNLQSGFSGSLDPTGWSMVAGSKGQPRFVKTGGRHQQATSKPHSTTFSPMVPGDENWDGRFTPPGTNGAVRAIAISGTDVYVGGNFTTAGGAPANYIAKWNGSAWSALGSGMNSSVNAIAINGTTGDVYVGGYFTTAGGVPARAIAKWNPSGSGTWSALSFGNDNGMNGEVDAIAISGTYVYAGGGFTTAGGTPANYIAEWIGSRWSVLGGASNGTSGIVNAIAISGRDVYVGGQFTTAGGDPARAIAKWNGSTWSALVSGTSNGVNGSVDAIAISGSDVYAGGFFDTAGGDPASNIAKWNITTSAWSALGSGMGSTVNAIAISGSDVYVGGNFTTAGGDPASNIAKWNITTSAWSALGSGMGSTVNAIAISGSDVYAGGNFTTAGGVTANYIARWDGSAWSALSSGMSGNGMNNYVRAIAISGSDVYAGGWFTTAGGVAANRIAKWNGSAWSALGSGTSNGVNGIVYAIAISGNNVYVGGGFTMAGGVAANYIAKWNGSAWSALVSNTGNGTNGIVYAIAISGNDVYAGGSFSTAGGVPANYIAKWNGNNAWSALGNGMDGPVYAIAISGGDMYAGGLFTTADGMSASNIAKWNIITSTWSALVSDTGNGVNGAVSAIAISGTDVYVGGSFTTAGGDPANRIAKWNITTSTWSALASDTGNGLNGYVNAIAISGSDVYAGGFFTTAGGVPASNIAKWDTTGSTWSALGSGTNSSVNAMAISEGDVYVGGNFTTAGMKVSRYFGIWHIPPPAPPTPTDTPTPIPSSTPATATPMPSGTPATDTPTSIPTDTPTTDTPTSIPTGTSTSIPTGTSTTVTPTSIPTGTSTPIPTDTPTSIPTGTSTTVTPTQVRTGIPSVTTTPTGTPTGVNLVGHVTWAGQTQPNALQQRPITLTLCLASGGPTSTYAGTTDASGFFTVNVASLIPGTYNWRDKGRNSLANGGTLTLTGSNQQAEMGAQKGGDSNGDNVANSLDFNILRATFQSTTDLRADYNNDGVVNGQDFNTLKSNYGLGGAAITCP